MCKTILPTLLALAMALCAVPAAQAAPGDQPVAPLPKAKLGDDKARTRTASLPAKGLFVGDQLTDATKAKLTELILEALGLRVEIALLVPVGPWTIDGAQHTDHDLNKARLDALRKFLADRGVDPKRIFVESQVNSKITEPRLDVQLLGQPAND